VGARGAKLGRRKRSLCARARVTSRSHRRQHRPASSTACRTEPRAVEQLGWKRHAARARPRREREGLRAKPRLAGVAATCRPMASSLAQPLVLGGGDSDAAGPPLARGTSAGEETLEQEAARLRAERDALLEKKTCCSKWKQWCCCFLCVGSIAACCAGYYHHYHLDCEELLGLHFNQTSWRSCDCTTGYHLECDDQLSHCGCSPEQLKAGGCSCYKNTIHNESPGDEAGAVYRIIRFIIFPIVLCVAAIGRFCRKLCCCGRSAAQPVPYGVAPPQPMAMYAASASTAPPQGTTLVPMYAAPQAQGGLQQGLLDP
jgi:hypothetical protein